MAHIWGFGCAHDPVGARGSGPSGLWAVSPPGSQGRLQGILPFCLPTCLSFSPPATATSPQRAHWPLKLQHVWVGRPPLTALPPNLLGWKDRAGRCLRRGYQLRPSFLGQAVCLGCTAQWVSRVGCVLCRGAVFSCAVYDFL